MVTVRELLAEELSDEDFLRRYPHPALVFDPPGRAVEGLRVDTPDQPFFTGQGLPTLLPDVDEVGTSTEVMRSVDACQATGLATEGLLPDTVLEWLVKSQRNPFGALITIGRTPNNDIVLPQPTVSKVHAIATHAQGGWSLSDSRSSNGTFVDGVRLPPGEKRPLEDGAELRFGRELRARVMLPASLLDLLRVARRRRRRREPGWE